MSKDIPNERCYQVESARYGFIASPGWEIRQFEPFYSLSEKQSTIRHDEPDSALTLISFRVFVLKA